ncbi:hypothetical protein LBW52_18890 [Ralstonia solanacearum]|uniref:hypothetical protein n=1 Tax=Ralstonia solanacearum TaxID=305 RepID=UPI002304E7DA|nr:hypothetical protein [Ralstonia solanacearum]MDB0568079.1 hypothetical protein [Ralstonia solanacearum]
MELEIATLAATEDGERWGVCRKLKKLISRPTSVVHGVALSGLSDEVLLKDINDSIKAKRRNLFWTWGRWGAMSSRLPTDIDRATVVGYWVGLASLAVGIAGFGFTVYLAFKKPESIFLIASGWIAAILLGVVSVCIGSRLISTIVSLQQIVIEQVAVHDREVRELRDQIAALNADIASARERAEQAITVSHFIAAKAVRTPPKPRTKAIDGQENEGD